MARAGSSKEHFRNSTEQPVTGPPGMDSASHRDMIVMVRFCAKETFAEGGGSVLAWSVAMFLLPLRIWDPARARTWTEFGHLHLSHG